MIKRRYSKQLDIGGVKVGGDAPIVVQSMTTTNTTDVEATLRQIAELADAGCELIRVAVPDRAAAAALPELCRRSRLPVIADIHFDYRLALAAISAGVAALRLNPGNIRRREHVEAVVRAAKERGLPIRVGVNAGSLPPIRDSECAMRRDTAEAMVKAALAHVRLLEELDFDLIKISLKAFDVPTTIAAYRSIAPLVPYPLHLGITEAGTPRAGSIRSAVGIGILLYDGIGDTIRVSLTGDSREEVFAAYEILRSLNLRQRGPTMISCPTCGRVEIDLVSIANQAEQYLRSLKRDIKVAVMGCAVNGPGEAREADVGIAGGKGKGLVFRKGVIVRSVPEGELLQALISEIDQLCRVS